MSESIELFGVSNQKVGIMSLPAQKARTCVLMWDVGLSHRIGPQRQYVEFGRQLQALGYPVMRFDLSGLGDSEPRKDGLMGEDSEVADIREAMDHLQKKGFDEFIIVGFCSSAANAHPTAVLDPRVKGVVLMEPYAYKTKLYWFHHYFHRLFRFGYYKKFIQRRLNKVEAPQYGFFRDYPPLEKVANEIQGLVNRGTKLFYLYSGVRGYYNYRRQFFDMFPSLETKGLVEVQYHPKADHLFTSLEARSEAYGQIQNWIQVQFPTA